MAVVEVVGNFSDEVDVEGRDRDRLAQSNSGEYSGWGMKRSEVIRLRIIPKGASRMMSSILVASEVVLGG